jgi:alpha-glucuronidase
MTGWRIAAALIVGCLAISPAAHAQEDSYSGSQMWLHYVPVSDPTRLAEYRSAIGGVVVENAGANKVHRTTAGLAMAAGSSEKLVETTLEAARDELSRGLGALLDRPVTSDDGPGAVVVGTRGSSPLVAQMVPAADLGGLGPEGYLIRSTNGRTVIAGNSELGALYGTFAFLRLIQTQKPIGGLNVSSSPKIKRRHLNYWETERLYAGNNAAGTGGVNGENGAVFDFAATGASASKNLPVILDRYIVVARALASLGINGITINNVNANNVYLTNAYLAQEAALADALRPYGVRLAVSINYTAPTDSRFAPDTLTNQQLDPYSAAFRGWWTRKAQQIKSAIPDFVGFTVKANSEGQPGPQDFGYDHGDGANGIAAAVAPLDMTVFWRTFVYNASVDNDRLKRAYLEFAPIDAADRFADNVFLQTKNGPLDFQPREPIHPMFGRIKNTNQAIELQITQEYTGQNRMLTYLAPMWEEVLKTETGAPGQVGEIVARGDTDSAIVGVANLGNAENVTGHHFSQANLYAWGRLAWDWTLGAEDIAREWVRMTWSNDAPVIDTIVKMMMGSREALTQYQGPLGIGHQFRSSDHYGPMPDQWFQMDEWSPVYYNKADSGGLGFDRSPTGSNLVAQYFPTLQQRYGNIDTTPENLLAWFHHIPWDRTMASGRPFWDELVYRYQMGVQYVTWMRETWDTLEPLIGTRRFSEVKAKLAQHETDAASWRDASINYFREFSGREIPTDDGPLSARITVGGRTHGGFNLSSASYTIPVAAGASPAITDVATNPGATAQIVSQADSVPGQAVVKVTKTDFFGPIVKNYVFNLVPDTTLKSLKVNSREIVKPGVTSYRAVFTPTDTTPKLQAVASDPAATVAIEPGKVTVTNGDASTAYTIAYDRPNTGSDEFSSLGDQWQVVRPDDARRRLSDGALVITSQNGDLQGNTNTAKNLVLQDVNGDWTIESKLVFSRPLAANNEQGGIIAYNSDQNYVKVAWEMANATAPLNKRRVVVIREQNGAASTIQVTGSDAQRIVGENGAIWLRLAKTGNTYKAYYSGNGSVWRYFATTTLNVDTPRAGVFAFNRGGTSTDLDVAFDYFHIASQGDAVPSLSAEAETSAGATVPATLALTLGAPATFGAFTPGVAREYTASTTANVISTAGDAALTTSGGTLTNGAFSLAQPLQIAFSRSAWTAPVSNDAVAITFKQAISANEALRTGSYSKTVTFTLSTTTP